jgi:hypothetical protein
MGVPRNADAAEVVAIATDLAEFLRRQRHGTVAGEPRQNRLSIFRMSVLIV